MYMLICNNLKCKQILYRTPPSDGNQLRRRLHRQSLKVVGCILAPPAFFKECRLINGRINVFPRVRVILCSVRSGLSTVINIVIRPTPRGWGVVGIIRGLWLATKDDDGA